MAEVLAVPATLFLLALISTTMAASAARRNLCRPLHKQVLTCKGTHATGATTGKATLTEARPVVHCVQGDWIGCKPTLAVIKYMESTATSLQQLQQQLAQVLAAEQASSSSSCSAAPTSPACKSSSGPAQPTCSTPKPDAAAAVMHIGSSPQQQQKAVHQHQQGCKESGPSIARLLYNVELVHRTLAGMDDLEGFQQVAHGKLELWYKHDTVNQQQLLKARTVLDEPVVVS